MSGELTISGYERLKREKREIRGWRGERRKAVGNGGIMEKQQPPLNLKRYLIVLM